MNFPQLLLKRIGPFLDRYDVLDYSGVICLKIIVHPREYFTILFEKVNKVLSILWHSTCTEIHKLWVLFHSRFIYSCGNVELWVLAFIGPWKWFCKSIIFFSDTTPLGMRFPLLVLVESYRDYSCSSSSIDVSLKTSTLAMNWIICWSS